jgi:glycerophosphoryl diester phosphodiesterase
VEPADHGGSVPLCVAAAAALAGGGEGVAAAVWAPDHTGLTRRSVEQARALGLSVLPWTVNRPADMQRLIAWDVDGLISDRPDLVLQVASVAGWGRQSFLSGAKKIRRN